MVLRDTLVGSCVLVGFGVVFGALVGCGSEQAASKASEATDASGASDASADSETSDQPQTSRDEPEDAGSQPVDPPNILFVMSDDHAYQTIGAYAGVFAELDPTPNLDRLAAQGVRFSRSFVTNSICAPSRAAMLTGKYSHFNGVRTWEGFDGAQQTLPKLLQEAGYHTVLVGKWHLNTDPTGFDEWMRLPGQGDYFEPLFLTPEHGPDNPLDMEGYVSEIITREAEKRIKNRPGDKPLALFVHHKAAHIAFDCDPRDQQWLEGVTLPEPPSLRDDLAGRPAAAYAYNRIPNVLDVQAKTAAQYQEVRDKRAQGVQRTVPPWSHTIGSPAVPFVDPRDLETIHTSGHGNPIPGPLSTLEIDRSASFYQDYVRAYLRTARSIDRSIGELMDVLEAEQIADSTAVFYTSDQGFFIGEHGMSDKRWAYEQSMGTPLIVRMPGQSEGAVVDKLVMNIDLMPTMLQLAGAPIPSDVQGRSLVPLLQGDSPADWREAVYYRYYADMNYRMPQHQAVRTEQHKLIYFPDEGHFFNSKQRYELYDLLADADERTNLADDPNHAELLEEMKGRLQAARAAAEDTDPEVFPYLIEHYFPELRSANPQWREGVHRTVPEAP